MEYCTYCAEALTKPFEVCPHCNKILDFDVLMQIYNQGKSSRINKKAVRKIWLKEHRRMITATITLLIGLAGGAVAAYTFAQQQFRDERASYEARIAGLLGEVRDNEAAVGDVRDDLQSQLDKKEEILGIVTEQKEILSQIIRFTNRLARNSAIRPNSQNDADYFRRNARYLANQFDGLQEKLKLTDHTPIKAYNLETVPQLMGE